MTVFKEVARRLPNEDFVYIGDTARVPYGSKSKEAVTRFTCECAKFLKRRGIKLLIVACNTASSWALEGLKQSFAFPVMGVIKPAVSDAARATRNGNLLIGSSRV